MPLSPLVVVIGVVLILSVALLLVVAFEERFDEKTAAEFEHDVAYHAMLTELREMQSPNSPYRPHPVRATGTTGLYESNYQGI